MYKYLNKSDIDKTKRFCAQLLCDLRDVLHATHNINIQFILVGSGSTHMVIQNDDDVIDFDYNIIVKNSEIEGFELKKKIINVLNNIFSEQGLPSINDTSDSIETGIIEKKGKRFKINFELIRKEEDGNWSVMILDKNSNSHYWFPIDESIDYESKVKQIKESSANWLLVRDKYLSIKNNNLSKGIKELSFISYINSVNVIFQNYCSKKY